MEIRLLNKSEYEIAARLSNSIFRRSEQQRPMEIIHPLVFSTGFNQGYGAFIEKELACFFGLVPIVIHIGPSRLRCYAIGSVCTAPPYRGQGIAGKVLERVKEHAVRAGASLLLVSGDGGLYRKAHCYPFGEMMSGSIQRDNALVQSVMESGDMVVREMAPTDWFDIYEIAAERAVRYEQSVFEWATLLESAGKSSLTDMRLKIMVAEREGFIQTFMVMGISQQEDSKRVGSLIEWAGDPQLLPMLAGHSIQKNELTQLDYVISRHEEDALHVLKPYMTGTERNLGTIHVLDPVNLLHQLKPYFREFGLSHTESLQANMKENGQIILSRGGGEWILDHAQFISAIFDPRNENNPAHDSMDEIFGPCLPVPFPYTGGINYI